MNVKKEYQKYLRQYEHFLNIKGRKRYFLLGFIFLVCMNLLAIIPGVVYDIPGTAIRSVTVIVSIGLLLNFIISVRLRYLRDVMIWGIIILLPTTLNLFLVGFMLIFRSGQSAVLYLTLINVLFSVAIIFRRGKREYEKWELARNKGFLRKCLDEQDWVYDNSPDKVTAAWLDFEKAKKGLERQKSALRWLKRLEKLHFLAPGIAIFFHRAFGNGEIISGVLLIAIGLVFASVNPFPFYLKIREWEKEKGKPLWLREIWEKEQQQYS